MSGPTTSPTPSGAPPLRALVVDDEAPTLAELAWLLGRDARVGEVRTASSGTEALRVLEDDVVDVVFSDVSMPGLDGLDLARVLARFSRRPQVVFVTAYDDHAVDAFELAATDYVMKPIRAERLGEAVRRVLEKRDAVEERDAQPGPVGHTGPTGPAGTVGTVDETIPVELGGVTTFVRRSRIRYATAHGDYARLHTDSGSHLVRISLNALEERWGDAGFVRIHRSTLVALGHVTAVSTDGGRCRVQVGDTTLQVSRRHTRALRERLLRVPR